MELRACPFCNGAIKIREITGSDEGGERYGFAEAACHNRECKVNVFMHVDLDHSDDDLAPLNTRPIEDDLRAEVERLQREQVEFTGAVLCALGVNRDESVAPGNQVLAEVEALKAKLALRLCVWTDNDSGPWETECGHTFEFIDGGPEDNDFKFCCYCGGELVAVAFDEEACGE